MNWLPLSRYAPKKTLVNRGFLVASILLLGAGCRVPLLNPTALASVTTPIQQVSKPLVEPASFVKQVSLETPVEATEARLSQIDAGDRSTSQVDESGVSHSPGDNKIWNYDPKAQSGAESNLAVAEAWKLDRHSDARTDPGDFSGLLEQDRSPSLIGRMWDDQKNFYSAESLTLLGGGLIVGGAMANSSIDDGIHRHFQSSVRGATSDDWFESLHASKELGNGVYTLPVFATAWAAGELFPDNALVETSGRWGERSLRGFVVGAPPLIIMQQLTGGSRPTETDENSEWHPFRDNNGISGHAFMGSLPFITAAKMTDNRGYKVLFYAGSAIAPLSRVNDNAHYPSQVALGWWMAYLAASAIDATDNPNARWRFYPYSTGDGSGMMAEFRY
ncbi:phosphatase PAP2 family protein [Pirellulaceae bacterium SH467]